MLTDNHTLSTGYSLVQGINTLVEVTPVSHKENSNSTFKRIARIYNICKESGSNFYIVLFNFFWYKVKYRKNILAHERAIINGAENIKSNTIIQVGLGNAKFMHKHDVTYLNISGSLFFKGNHTIGRGCRIDIAPGAEMIVGSDGYINANTSFIINHKLVIGDDCAISWNCQFLDEDFHTIEYDGKVDKANEIELGNHIWVGCDVKIYKGTVIPDGCVIAAGSVLRGVFTEKNALIGGNPAKVIKQNVKWK